MYRELEDIVDEYLYDDLPYDMENYLIAIGYRNLMILTNALMPHMGADEWLYVNIGRLMSKRRLPIIHMEHLSHYVSNDRFIKLAIKSKRRDIIDHISSVETHILAAAIASGGYATYKWLHETPFVLVNLLGFCQPEPFYTITLHPDYPSVKMNILYAAFMARNSRLAGYILGVRTGIVEKLDRWVLKSLPLPGQFEKMVKSQHPLLMFDGVDGAFQLAVRFGMYIICKTIKPELTTQICSNPAVVHDFLLTSICENDVESVRELVKYKYVSAHIDHAIFYDTNPDIIRLIDFDDPADAENPRVLLYKRGCIRRGAVLQEFSSMDLPALLDPDLVCTKEFLIPLVEYFAVPKFHPLYNRHKYKRELTAVLVRLSQMESDRH
jgi:hypothetical protein